MEGTIQEFIDWKSERKVSHLNPFKEFDISSCWAYADYKFMVEMKNEGLIDEQCIDWSAFGFFNRNANDSTFWLGTGGAYTPCHFDTYGYNLVFQAHGMYVLN